jgi:Cu(I)/Ag(I) efflux system membrane fusion protein
MLRNKLAMTVMGVATISLVVGGGAGYWFAHQRGFSIGTVSEAGC